MPTYFHGSRSGCLGPGDVLRPGGMPDFDSSSEELDLRWAGLAEDALEAGRPPGTIPRRQAVFLVDRPDADLVSRSGGATDILLEVEAEGAEKSDVAWWYRIFDEVIQEDGADQELIRDMVRAYWAGEPTESPDWEYRVRSAKVTAVLDPAMALGGERGMAMGR